MLHHHLPVAIHKDPFHFPSSSPEKLNSRSYVATRPNPYTIKSQINPHYTSLRTTAHSSIPLDPRLATSIASTKSPTKPLYAVDSLYSSLEAANTSPRCTSKPPPLPSRASPTLTMVKPKPRPIKALALSADVAAAKRLTGAKVASAAAEKRRRSVNEAAKQHSRGVNLASSTPLPIKARSKSRSRSPTQSISPGSASPPRLPTPRASKLTVPKITIRAPTPEPIPTLDPAVQPDGCSATKRNDANAPLYMDGLFTNLTADMTKVEDGIDSILSKYFDTRKPTTPICTELLRYLATALCRLYCCVEDPESELGLLKLRAIGSHLFKHVVTGFVHLLDDRFAPYSTAGNLAYVSSKVLQDFDTATNWCCHVLNGPARAQKRINHGELFLQVLNAELDKILEKGLAMTNMHNKLSLPGQGSSLSQSFSMHDLSVGNASSIFADTLWQRRSKLRKQWAQEGDEKDQFVGIDVIRFIGQLVLYQVVDVQVLAKWLDRFLVHTVYLDIPSVWEIECACALLLSVGATFDRRSTPAKSPLLENGHVKAKKVTACCTAAPSGSVQGMAHPGDWSILGGSASSEDGPEVLNRAMERIAHLIDHSEISRTARSWLIQLRKLRERGWKRREDEAISLEDGLSSSSSSSGSSGSN